MRPDKNKAEMAIPRHLEASLLIAAAVPLVTSSKSQVFVWALLLAAGAGDMSTVVIALASSIVLPCLFETMWWVVPAAVAVLAAFKYVAAPPVTARRSSTVVKPRNTSKLTHCSPTEFVRSCRTHFERSGQTCQPQICSRNGQQRSTSAGANEVSMHRAIWSDSRTSSNGGSRMHDAVGSKPKEIAPGTLPRLPRYMPKQLSFAT